MEGEVRKREQHVLMCRGGEKSGAWGALTKDMAQTPGPFWSPSLMSPHFSSI